MSERDLSVVADVAQLQAALDALESRIRLLAVFAVAGLVILATLRLGATP